MVCLAPGLVDDVAWLCAATKIEDYLTKGKKGKTGCNRAMYRFTRHVGRSYYSCTHGKAR